MSRGSPFAECASIRIESTALSADERAFASSLPGCGAKLFPDCLPRRSPHSSRSADRPDRLFVCRSLCGSRLHARLPRSFPQLRVVVVPFCSKACRVVTGAACPSFRKRDLHSFAPRRRSPMQPRRFLQLPVVGFRPDIGAVALLTTRPLSAPGRRLRTRLRQVNDSQLFRHGFAVLVFCP